MKPAADKRPEGRPPLRPHMPRSAKPQANAILAEVQRRFGVSAISILSEDRTPSVQEARAAAMELFPWSDQTTGQVFGVRGGAVWQARRTCADWCDVDQRFRQKLEGARAALGLLPFPRRDK